MGLSCTEYFNCMAGQNKSFSPLYLPSFLTLAPLRRYHMEIQSKMFIIFFASYEYYDFVAAACLKLFLFSPLCMCVDSISDYNRLKEHIFY